MLLLSFSLLFTPWFLVIEHQVHIEKLASLDHGLRIARRSILHAPNCAPGTHAMSGHLCLREVLQMSSELQSCAKCAVVVVPLPIHATSCLILQWCFHCLHSSSIADIEPTRFMSQLSSDRSSPPSKNSVESVESIRFF